MATIANNSKQWWILRDSNGKRSVSFTMMWVSFVILSLWLTLNIVETPHIREFSGETALVWFSPLAALYFGRKGQKGRLAGQDSPSSTAVTTTVTTEVESDEDK